MTQEDWTGCIGLVGICNELERMVMYEEIKEATSTLTSPCILLGDFNEILRLEDRRG